MPVLRIKLPNQGEVTHVLSGERISIGRRPDNTIQILERSVSAHHAELIAVNGHYRLHDLASTNLSFVEGEPVTDYHLHGTCKVAFGTVECEFDASAESAEEPKLTVAQLEQDAAFLRDENSELTAKLDTLQRRIDILSSARLVTGRTDQAPGSAAADSLRSLERERDDLRHQNTGLLLELERLREELTFTIRERDAARQQVEILQIDKAGLHREPRGTLEKLDTPPAGIAAHGTPRLKPVDEASSTQRLLLARSRTFERLAPLLHRLREAIDRLAAAPADTQAREEASQCATHLIEQVLSLGDHALVRLAHSLDDLLRDFQPQGEPARPTTLHTLNQAVELFGTLIEPQYFERGKALPPAEILAIDDDSELLATVVATLQLAQIQTHTCGSAEEALVAVAARKYDLVLADVNLPGIDGITFCKKTREIPGYRKTPIVFLTISDTLGRRAESVRQGGNDFISKPFSVFDLALNVQTWVLKQQLGLLG